MLYPLDSPPCDTSSKKLRPKPTPLHLNIAHINSSPAPLLTPPRRPAGWDPTDYIDQVAMLRNPHTAPSLQHYLATGHAMGRTIGVHTRQKAAKREPAAGAQDGSTVLEKDAGASLAGGVARQDCGSVQRVNASGEFVKSPKRALSNTAVAGESGKRDDAVVSQSRQSL